MLGLGAMEILIILVIAFPPFWAKGTSRNWTSGWKSRQRV